MERDRLAWGPIIVDGEDRDIPGGSDIDTVDHDRLPVGMRMRTADTSTTRRSCGISIRAKQILGEDIASRFVLVYTALFVLAIGNYTVLTSSSE
jgi:hypothetical protein